MLIKYNDPDLTLNTRPASELAQQRHGGRSGWFAPTRLSSKGCFLKICMSLTDVPNGVSTFLGANIFIYHFTGLSIECRDVLERAERREISALTGCHIILEVLHRLMMIEAISKGVISHGQPAKKLKRSLESICALTDYKRSVTEISKLGVRVYPITMRLIRDSQRIRDEYGVMTNDSVTAAMMLNRGVRNLASLDSDLNRVPGLNIYAPRTC